MPVLVDLLRNDEALLGIEAELLLELLNIVGLERSTVGGGASLIFGAETDGGLESDEGGLIGYLLCLLDCLVHAFDILVTVVDGNNVPVVGEVSLLDILGEGTGCITVDGYVVVVVDADKVAELQVAGERTRFG